MNDENESRYVPIVDVGEEELLEYCEEFKLNNEKENVTYDLDNIGYFSFMERQRADGRNLRYALCDNGHVVGLLRASKSVTYPANGMIGYSVRPSERRKGYGTDILEFAVELYHKLGFEHITACVNENNWKSVKTLEKAGFVRTGTTYDWLPDPLPRRAIEFSHW